MPFEHTNTTLGIAENADFQAGVSNVDQGIPVIKEGILLPWPSDPAASYLYYDCTVGAMLDSGIVVHNRLPQVNRSPDTLASIALDDSNLEREIVQGVNLRCQDQYQDIVQRMGHARYWFRIWGQALRAGYKVPIPGIRYIGGIQAIPYDKNPQWAFNRILPGGNYSGVILWHAGWSLWYTTAAPPSTNYVPGADPSAHITGAVAPPANGIQAPYVRPDDNAVKSAPPRTKLRPG